MKHFGLATCAFLLVVSLSVGLRQDGAKAAAHTLAGQCDKGASNSSIRSLRVRTFVLRPNLRQVCTIGWNCTKELIRKPKYELLLDAGVDRSEIHVTYHGYNADRAIYMVVIEVGDIHAGSAKVRLSGRCR